MHREQNRKGRLEREFKDLSRSRLQIHDIAAIPSTNHDLSPGRKFGSVISTLEPCLFTKLTDFVLSRALLLVGTVVAEVADPSSEKAEFQRPRDAKPERRLVGKDADECHGTSSPC